MQFDQETGLYHTWFPQFDPNQARWMSVDPLPGSADAPQSLDRYTNVLNDPVNLADPQGLSVEFIQGQAVSCSLDDLATPCAELFDRLRNELGNEFDILREAFTPTGKYWGPNCADPDEDCGAGWHYVFGNWSLLNILELPQKPQKPKKENCIERIMLVTAYTGHGPGADWNYYKPKKKGQKPRSVGPGTVAVANTSPTPYPFGSTVTVFGYDHKSVAYSGAVHDTGAGWDNAKRHHNVQPDQWIDIWKPTKKAADQWGVQYRWVKICPP